MAKAAIRLRELTKDYGEGRGIFGVNLDVREGEMLGFVGTNGSGKTTSIRLIMGFLRPTSGEAFVKGMETWSHASEIARYIGYVPGEISFPDLPTGTSFLRSQAEFLGVKDRRYAASLVERLQLDTSAPLKLMSKGMKQKTAIVAALMADPPILVLDEPTTGLDPLMRESFVSLIEEEHARGKTVFMSGHMFEEMEDTCDRVAMIRNGRIVDVAEMSAVLNRPVRQFKIEFLVSENWLAFQNCGFRIVREQPQYFQATAEVEKADINRLMYVLAHLRIKFVSEVRHTLERHFKEILESEKAKKEDGHVQ